MTDSTLARSLQVLVHILTALLLPPLLPGLINKVKALVAGRQGPPVLQLYYDLAKLARKQAVFSRTTTWVFLAGPAAVVAAGLVASLLVPFGHAPAPVHFQGDMILFAYLFGAGPVRHRALGPGHRLQLRGHGRGPGGDLLGADRARPVPGLRRPGQGLRQPVPVRDAGARPGFAISRATGPLILVLAGWMIVSSPRTPASRWTTPTPTWSSP